MYSLEYWRLFSLERCYINHLTHRYDKEMAIYWLYDTNFNV